MARTAPRKVGSNRFTLATMRMLGYSPRLVTKIASTMYVKYGNVRNRTSKVYSNLKTVIMHGQ